MLTSTKQLIFKMRPQSSGKEYLRQVRFTRDSGIIVEVAKTEMAVYASMPFQASARCSEVIGVQSVGVLL